MLTPCAPQRLENSFLLAPQLAHHHSLGEDDPERVELPRLGLQMQKRSHTAIQCEAWHACLD